MTQTRDGATTALHRRIEELTAELAKSRAKYDRDISDKEIAHQVDLATERAAREALSSANGLLTHDISDLHDQLEQAERERDTALARVKELEANDNESWKWKCCHADHEASLWNERALAAETALASARILIEQAADGEHEWSPKFRGECASWLTSHPAPVAAPCAGCALLLRRLRELTEYYMLEVRNSEDRLKRVHRLQAQLARVGTRLHVKRAEAAHWMRAADASHHTKRVTVNALLVNQRALRANYDACHRQHEQCMKLLQRVRPYAPRHCKLDQLICEMLEKGELPEGWDE